ncbi:hypothetical protein K1T71_008496 [Dendrolimus kikuchii]|uniref:Uncharacterized protein n=1 Tax=Dendrolimus kikuchii TaxID=765133 RepID=A0ACC1CYG7_9NEOP|nr:hypothetical protein K1T71_008496 [Dendrolimus kikuchii]
MNRITFKINCEEYSVGEEISSDVMLVDYLRNHLELRGTKYMCRRAGCGACIVAVVKTPGSPPVAVNSCMVSITSCQNWDITTIEEVGNRNIGYHPIQKTLAKCNGSQCGYCSPGWVMAMYSLLKNKKKLTMLEIEKSFASNVCRCTGYRSILEAFKQFADDAPKSDILDIEELSVCNKANKICTNTCDSDWCIVDKTDLIEPPTIEIHLSDGKKWFRPKVLDDILRILKKAPNDNYQLVAGNTAKGVYPIEEYPPIMIDVSGLTELKGFFIDQNLVIRAGTTLSELQDIFNIIGQQDVFSYLNILNKHLELVAHIAVRNIGTIAGNLMIKHQYNEFPSDIYLMLETVGAEITIPDRQTAHLMERGLPSPMDICNTKLYLPPIHYAHAQLNICVVLQSVLKILNTELVVEEIPPEPSVAYRRKLALGLFYKGLLSICPANSVSHEYQSGGNKIRDNRPVSEGKQSVDTNPALWPINQPIQKLEALIQCAGEAKYTEDLPSYPHEVFGAFVLSTVPKGFIVEIDPSKALHLPGVIAFYTAKDIPGLNSFMPAEDMINRVNEEVISNGEISYYDQPIAIIVAKTRHLAYFATKLVDVKYSNVKKPVIDVQIAKKDPERVNLLYESNAKIIGNDIHKVIKGNNTIYGQYHYTMESIACVTIPSEDGLEVHATSQWMDGMQLMISRALNIDCNSIDIHVRRLGGAYGIKISRSIQVAVACSLVAYKLNRPCRFLQSMTATTKSVGKRFPSSSEYEIGVNTLGIIEYCNYNLYEDNGFVRNEKLSSFIVNVYNNVYNSSSWNFKIFDVTTDTASNTFFRAPGTLEAVSLAEQLMEQISYELSLDPIQVRIANLDSAFSEVKEMIERIKKEGEYSKRQDFIDEFNSKNRWRKRGLRFSISRFNHEYARYFDVNMSVYHGDGSVSITHGGIEIGQGINTKAAQVAAYLLNIPIHKIKIKATNTIVAPNAAVTGGSLTCQNIIIGVTKCCKELLKTLEPLRSRVESPTWENLIKEAFDSNIDLQYHGFVNKDDMQFYQVYGVALAEVEIDVLTGEYEILRVDILQDVGMSISPAIDIGQVEGAFVMGLGYWTCEQLVYNNDTGELLTDSSWNYYIPLARDIPQDFRVYFRKNSYTSKAIFGSKSIGEPPICLTVVVPFAIRAAIVAARAESGLPSTTWFSIAGPYTIEEVGLACETRIEDFKFN